MHISLKPEMERFIDQQVKAGRYDSAEDVLQEALTRMIEEDAEYLDADVQAAISESEAQIARGEYRSWKEVSKELRAKYLSR